jgi:RsiW-degrading membrane proteinase PrsW (M82 family)
LFSYTSTNSLYSLAAVVLFASILSVILYVLIHSGSVYARVLLQQFASVNTMIIVTLLAVVLVSTSTLPGGVIIALSIFPLLISSLIEESSKHLMSIGLMSQDFAFSRRDIIIFTLFVVLGFVFIENLLYLIV